VQSLVSLATKYAKLQSPILLLRPGEGGSSKPHLARARLPFPEQVHVSKIQWTPLRPSGDPPAASVSILLRCGMDRATIERNLAQVERDLRAASEDLAHQQETLRNLVRHGENTTEAQRSIGILKHTHLVLSSLRDQLDEELAALDQA
jgi:hypothetical protein